MKVNSYIFKKNPPKLFIATLAAVLLIFIRVEPALAGITVIDSLGAATPATQFSVFGSGGAGFNKTELIGAKFTLTQPTLITEIGGFVNNCGIIILGVPMCPNTLPLTVQIRPSTNGLPDASIVLASFALSPDNLPLIVSYESAATDIRLEPGTYFLMFTAQGSDSGVLLRTAFSPFQYHPDPIELATRNLSTGATSTFTDFAAVRILGERNVIVDGCDSGVPDADLLSGSTITDAIVECAEATTNHGQFVSCVAHVTADLKNTGTITGQQKGAIQSCVGYSDSP